MTPDMPELYVRRLPARQFGSVYAIFARDPARFSVLLENPKGEGRQFLLSRDGRSISLGFDELAQAPEFVDAWRELIGGPVAHADAGNVVRCAVYAAYEAGRLIEKLPPPKGRPEGPVLWVHQPQWGITFLSDERQLLLFAWDDPALLDEVAQWLDAPIASPMPTPAAPAPDTLQVTDGANYKAAVERTKRYIGAGDIFQANIARYWQLPFDLSALLPLYERLRRVNAAPFAAWLAIDGAEPFHILSASPERLFCMHADGRVESRPIAGTRKRGAAAGDDQLRDEMLLSPKERAEHIMLVDLERNDLGRVCEPASVRVDELMSVERYATVQHIVSNVSGRLRAGMDFIDLFRAMFPGGTITGCPKVRCMEIIRELEERGRGPYTGGIGYIAADHSADMNILIRTFWHQDGLLHWAAGAGIVADSNPEQELEETDHKAAGLLRALV